MYTEVRRGLRDIARTGLKFSLDLFSGCVKTLRYRGNNVPATADLLDATAKLGACDHGLEHEDNLFPDFLQVVLIEPGGREQERFEHQPA